MEFAKILISVGGGLLMVSFGINQLMNPETWLQYIPQWYLKLSPFSATNVMRMHALGNVAFGLFLFIGVVFFSGLVSLVAAWVALVWMLSIVPFAFQQDWAIGTRDLTISLAFAALVALLTK